MSNKTASSLNQNSFLARFGATILRGGIAAIPNALFRYQAKLGLKPQQAWFISTILSHQWDASLPYPSLSKMAQQTGVSRRQLHNYQRQLVEMGLLEVINRQTEAGGKTTNHYDFGPLFERLEALLAEEQGQPTAAGLHVNARSHTHENLSSHPPENSRSHTHGNAGSHLKKTQKEDSEREDSEPFEVSKARRDKPKGGTKPAQRQARHTQLPVGTTATTVRALGDLLAARRLGDVTDRDSARPETLEEDYQRIQYLIADRAREFNDTAPLKSSITRAWRMYKRSGASIEVFEDRVFQAKALTQEGTARIRKVAADETSGARRKTKMAYFFAVLEDKLGLATKQPPTKGGEQAASSVPRKGRKGKYDDFVQR